MRLSKHSEDVQSFDTESTEPFRQAQGPEPVEGDKPEDTESCGIVAHAFRLCDLRIDLCALCDKGLIALGWLRLCLGVLTSAACLAAQTASSGLEDIDRTAREVAASPTTAANARERHAILSSWFRLLLHQGIDMSDYEPVLEMMKGGSGASGPFQTTAQEQRQRATRGTHAGIDEGYRVLARIQANPKKHALKTAPPSPAESAPAAATDWGLFHGGHGQAGHTDDPGPTQGKLAWRFPAGHAWYARPSIENGRVYIASPGLVTIAYCLDETTGRVIWKSKQYGLASYTEPRVTSGAVVLKDHIVVRECGSGGEVRNAVDLVYIDKATGDIAKQVRAGHVDYRRGYAPVTGNDRYLVHPRGYMAIQNKPALVWMLNTVALGEAQTGRPLWELRVGDIFGDPVIAGEEVYAATADGALYSLNTEGQARIRWVFDAGAPLPGTPEIAGDTVFIGGNDGRVHALDRATGKPRWSFNAATPDGHAFQFFSTTRMADGRVYIGAADQSLHCLDARTGALVWKTTLTDWVRSRPLVVGDTVFVATMDGNVHAFAHGATQAFAQKLWSARATTHQMLADLEGTPAGILASSNDLFLTSLDPKTGRVQWRHSLLESIYVAGQRVTADVVSGGADYQSPPAVVGGMVYIGCPNRFVYAIAADSGKEIWRYETSGQISAQPIVVNDRVYFGQQGGDKDYYCVDAKTGNLVWKKPLGWAWVSSGYRDGHLYIGTVEGDILGVRASDGATLWTHPTHGGIYPALATDETTVYTGSWDGHYYALDRANGLVRWAYHLGGHPDSAAPMLWKGKLIIQALSKYLDAIDVRTGQSAWKFNVPSGFDLNASPAASGDRIFFSVYRVVNYTPCGARVCAIDDQTGKKLWEFYPGGGLTGPSVARDRVYFASTADVFFTCVDARGNGDGTTSLIWRYQMGGVVEESCPAIHGRRAFILCSDRYLYAFE